MSRYVTRDKDGREVKVGDTVTSFRGETMVFQGVTRPPMAGKSAKVLADGREYYAEVFDLTITEE